MAYDTEPPTVSTSSERAVTIELTAAQIDDVLMGAASDPNNMQPLLSGLGGGHAALAARFEHWGHSRLSRPLSLALLILASFPADRRYMKLADIARKCATTPSTAHRYISTFMAAGLIERDPRTRRYRLIAQ